MARVDARHMESRTGRSYVLRTIVPDDAQALLDHTVDFEATALEFSVTLPEERQNSLEKRRAWVQEHLDEPDWLAIGAFDGGTPEIALGAVCFATHKLKRLRHMGTIGISVHSKCRDEGIGAALMQGVIDWARAHPTIECVGLNVFVSNARAVHLYRKLGFVDQYVQRAFIKMGPGEYQDDIRMALWVKDVPPARG